MRVWLGIQDSTRPAPAATPSSYQVLKLPLQLDGGQIIVLLGLFAGIAIFIRLNRKEPAQKAIPASAAPLPAGAQRRLWHAPGATLALIYAVLLGLIVRTVEMLPERITGRAAPRTRCSSPACHCSSPRSSWESRS
jgi:hypothetical protein